ncbi:helix-turn-helix domain-containing protein [Streptomyces koyangensis]|uniref:helix-turn-helix domain-containing protein n=1 Tax=Streptomyces koyangensis TaxID=188770 RepID=UPI003CFDB62B
MAALVPYSFAAGGPPAAPASGRGAGHALRVARALAHDSSDTRELAAWAAQLHISAKTLQRDLQGAFGMPCTRWRTPPRLSAARALLGTEPVTRIARRVGVRQRVRADPCPVRTRRGRGLKLRPAGRPPVRRAGRRTGYGRRGESGP